MNQQRYHYLDLVKGIGIFLVFLGHFVERLSVKNVNDAFSIWKWIYSFHMPLFFFISGFFLEKGLDQPFVEYIKAKFVKRIVPVLFFGAISIPLWLWLKNESTADLIKRALMLFSGHPRLNWVTWFLVCLFTSEIYLWFLKKTGCLVSRFKVFVTMLLFFAIGLVVTYFLNDVKIYFKVSKNFWYFHEALVATAIILMGMLTKKYWLSVWPKKWAFFILVVSGFLSLYSFDLNQGMFAQSKHQVVMMTSSSHGHPLYFIIGAFSGILFFMSLGQIFSSLERSPFHWFGKYSIIYLGLAGIGLHFIDDEVIKMVNFSKKGFLEILIYSSTYSLIILCLWSPVAFAFLKIFPGYLGLDSTKKT